MTSEERSAIDNGIWLCQSCGKEIDSDETYWTVERLRLEKEKAEIRARLDIGIKQKSHEAGFLIRVYAAAVVSFGMLLLIAFVVVKNEVPPNPSSAVRFRELSIYRVIPDPVGGVLNGATHDVHDSFVGVVLELKNESQRHTFEVQDLGFEGRVSFVPIEGGGIISRVQAFAAPAQVVGGFNLAPGSKGWAVVAFPFVHREEAGSALAGVSPRFEGDWSLVVDGAKVKVLPGSVAEGTVFVSKWREQIQDINLKLEPLMKTGGRRGAWERVE